MAAKGNSGDIVKRLRILDRTSSQSIRSENSLFFKKLGGIIIIKYTDKFKRRTLWNKIIINGKDTLYKISSYGVVINKHGKIVKSHVKDNGYYRVGIWLDGKRYEKSIHRLLLLAFEPISIKDQKIYQGNHINGDKSINTWYNLEWTTGKHNMQHAWDKGLYKKPIGELNNSNKYPESLIVQICDDLQNGVPISNIADKVGISRRYLRQIYRKERWKHITNIYDFKEQ